jgi:hypothetical protein
MSAQRLFCSLSAAISLVASIACNSIWDRQDAHRFCRGAIAAYPASPAPSCEALHKCGNEASLSAEEKAKLSSMLKAAGCEPL